MNRKTHLSPWLDDSPLVLARLHHRDMVRAAEQHRLLALARIERPERSPLRAAPLRWLRAWWAARRRAIVPAREMGV